VARASRLRIKKQKTYGEEGKRNTKFRRRVAERENTAEDQEPGG